MEEIVSSLTLKKETVATMESCTGGLIASKITDVSGSSEVFVLGLVTYSNAQKIRFGVEEELIKEFTVYSKEVAIAMAKSVASFARCRLGNWHNRNNSEDMIPGIQIRKSKKHIMRFTLPKQKKSFRKRSFSRVKIG